jgi:DNA-binding transcriptional regulator YiaG
MKPMQIIKLRESLGLNQQQFAELIGVSRKTVNQWEKGVHPPRGLSIKALEQLLEKQKQRKRRTT